MLLGNELDDRDTVYDRGKRSEDARALAFMTDKARVIGASTHEGDEKRLQLLPDGLHDEMTKILDSEYIAIGKGSVQFYGYPERARKELYIISRDENYQAPAGCKVVNDYMELVEPFKDSSDELTVIGGLNILKLFTPFASEIDVAETNELVLGDLVFDDWDKGDFELVSSREWKDGRTLHYVRKSPT